MDGQVEVKESAARHLPEGADERPLVTFALFAYNQEVFVREAIEAAFAQTYSPLEVILSDDCSSDRTFEIMQEMAAAYQGPHRVRLVKNEANMGLVQHFLTRCREAEGEFVVVAAGDDISKPERTTLAVAPLIADDEVYATVSLVDIIDDRGDVLAIDRVRPEHMSEADMYSGKLIFMNNCRSKRTVLQGCASTYRKIVFDIEIQNGKYNFAEDFLFSFYINLINKLIVEIPKSLVEYRMHNNAIANNQMHIDKYESREVSFYKFARDNIFLCDIFIGLSKLYDSTNNVKVDEILKRRNKMMLALIWKEIGLFKRMPYVIRGIFSKSGFPVKWMSARIFGSYPNYQPRSFIFSLLRKR